MASTDDFLSNLARSGRTRIAAALAVTALVGGGLSMIMLRAGGAEQALLYSGLDLTEAAEIAGRLDTANISYDLRGDGSSIFVDRAKVNDARIMLSSEGLPTRGNIGYEIFDKQDALGATSFVQNVNRLRALEGELARTIVSLGNVKSARVHLVLPERRLFERDSQPPSASIVVDVVGRSLDSGQIRAIRNLAAGAVPGLAPDAVTLLDSEGRLLASAVEGDGSGLAGGFSMEERRAAFEEELRRKVLAQIEPIVGPGAARVQISADMDFNRVTQSSEIYDPDGRVLRSTQTVEETSTEESRDGQQTVTAANNLPDGAVLPDDGVPETTDSLASSRLEETLNYEITKTLKTEVIEGGTIKRLSVAVAVDHAKALGQPGEDGTVPPPTFAPREATELSQIEALVKSAIGFDDGRGDVVEVVNLRFANPIPLEGAVASDGLLDFRRTDILRAAEIGALLIGGLALIIFVLRPLVSGLMSPPGKAGKDEDAVDPDDPLAIAATNERRAIVASEMDAMAGQANALGERIDVANVAGQVKASSMKKIADMVDSQPDETVAILRTWLSESEGSPA